MLIPDNRQQQQQKKLYLGNANLNLHASVSFSLFFIAAPKSDVQRDELEADALSLMLCPGQSSYTIFYQC